MPRLVVTPRAREGLRKCQVFLAPKNPLAARNAAKAIEAEFRLLLENPQMGRPFDEAPTLRELLIPFGTAGYTALYRVDGDAVVILAFRHMKEAGY